MSSSGSMAALAPAPQPLIELFDTALVDLDGVVYRGSQLVAHAAESIAQAKQQGVRVCYVTNNAARSPKSVGEHLRKLGVPAADEEVVTSAQAAARLVADQVPAGSSVLVVGGEGLVAALDEVGLEPVFRASERPAAVVQGFHPDIGWRLLAEGAYAVATGIPWIASNVDPTLPTSSGLAPGNGALVETLRIATGRSPLVAGKPGTALFHEARRRCGGERPLVIGDRLDTDIEGAHAAGYPSLLVLTGVTALPDLVTAPPQRRPTYLARTLEGLFVPHESPTMTPDGVQCGGWQVRLEPAGDGRTRPQVTGHGDPLDAARALLLAAWSSRDGQADVTEALARLAEHVTGIG